VPQFQPGVAVFAVVRWLSRFQREPANV
jgi:hypothetical protein